MIVTIPDIVAEATAWAAQQQEALTAHLEARFSSVPQSPALPSAVDRLVWGVTQYLEAPTTATTDALRLLVQAELGRLVLAEQWQMLDRLRQWDDAHWLAAHAHWLAACLERELFPVAVATEAPPPTEPPGRKPVCHGCGQVMGHADFCHRAEVAL